MFSVIAAGYKQGSIKGIDVLMPLSVETHVKSFISTLHASIVILEHSHMTSIIAHINDVDDLLIFCQTPVCNMKLWAYRWQVNVLFCSNNNTVS